MQPSVSVIVVSDYEEDNQKFWHAERLILTALANQDFREPFEILLVENECFRDMVPPDLYEITPNLQISFSEETQSAKLKDSGVKATSSEFIAVLEADCIPSPGWLRFLVEDLRKDSSISAVSGKTFYGSSSVIERSLSLLDRGFDDLGYPGVTRYISNNGALYRRELIEQFPYPDAISPFVSARLRAESIRRAGHQFFFEPQAVMQHAIGGWEFMRDFRRNTGYADIVLSQKLQYSAISKLLLKRLRKEWSDCLRLGPKYLRWYDWPIALTLLVILRIFEIPGMLDAVRGKNHIPSTSYR